MSEQREIPAWQGGWGRGLRPALCPHCDWLYLVPAEAELPRCPHCFHEQLKPLGEGEEAFHTAPPELALPFTLSKERLAQQVTRFAEGIPFPPEDLNADALRSRLLPIALPMWLVDAEVEGPWWAEVGFDYDVVSHQNHYDQNRGGWFEREVQETRVRWEPRVGRLHRAYHNVSAAALEDERALQQRLGSYDHRSAQAYRPEMMGRALIRLPDRSTGDAWPDAEPTVRTLAAKECQKAASADHFRQFRWKPVYTNRNWTLLLRPVYATYYLDDEGQPQPVLLHGQTGQINGARRGSMRRAQKTALIIAIVAAVIFVLSLILGAVGLMVPPLLVVAAIGIVVALLVGLGALVPIVRVWQFNRRQ